MNRNEPDLPSSRRMDRATAGAGPDDAIESILDALRHLRATDPTKEALAQFRSRVSADQYRTFYEVVNQALVPGSRVLDWGCGNGHASFGLSRLGYRVTGFSFEPCPLSRDCGDDYRFVPGDPSDPTALPFEDAAFDAVVSVGVLEHVRETGGTEAESLREIHRVLRPGGTFICYHFPNRHSLIEAVSASIPGKHHHRYRYIGEEIRRLAAGAGLEVKAIRRYGLLPRNLWHRAPRPIRNSRAMARVWNRLDRVLEVPFGTVAQNYLFVAQRPRGLVAGKGSG